MAVAVVVSIFQQMDHLPHRQIGIGMRLKRAALFTCLMGESLDERGKLTASLYTYIMSQNITIIIIRQPQTSDLLISLELFAF